MKKYLLPCLFLMLPLALSAQSGPVIFPDFYDGIKSAKSFVLDDHVNIMQVNTDNENFDIVAVNDQLQIIWRSSFAGFAFTLKKFKNKIIAISSTEHSAVKGGNNTYKAYLIDPQNGSLLAEKVIYTGDDDYMEQPSVFTGDGAYFKFCVRKSGLTRSLHVGLPGMLGIISINKYAREFNETREIDVITFNEKLEAASTVKLPVSPGAMINWSANTQGDLFIAWLNGTSIEVYKYADGSSSAAKQMKADNAFLVPDNVVLSEQIQLLASASNNNILYYGLTYANQDNDAELGIGKFDFSSGKQAYVTEAFNKDHVKALQKGFVPVNKKVDDADLGRRDGLQLRGLEVADERLIAVLTSRYTQSGMNGAWAGENSVLINVYDEGLNTKFQQILPASYTMPLIWLPLGYHVIKNKFYIVANKRSGINTFNGIYGCLDLSTGKWEKMEELSKKKIVNFGYSNGNATLWFGDSYVVSYFVARGISQSKFDITLQQNGY